MKVNINVESYAASKKLDTFKQPTKKEEFKKVLSSHESNSKNSSNENVAKVKNKDLDDDAKKTMLEGSDSKSLDTDEKSNKLKTMVLEFLESFTEALKQDTEGIPNELSGQEKLPEEMAQIQQLLQSLAVMFQEAHPNSQIEDKETQESSINLEQLLGFEKLTPSSKDMLKSNMGEIVAMLEKSKENSGMNSQIIEMLQKLATEGSEVKGDLNLLKTGGIQVINPNDEEKLVKPNVIKDVIKQSTNVNYDVTSKNQMQNSSDTSKDNKSSGNSSFEEKFLSNLLGEDKDEMKISKAVNFMNQFEAVKTPETSKVQTPNLVIDKNSLGTDVIKTIKFMEINNVKDLTVKMNPKELGEVTIKVVVESGVMKASISAQNKETYNLLNNNIQDISDKLKSMDIKIQSLDINIYEDSTFFSKDSNEKNNQGQQNKNTGINVELEEEDVSLSNNYAIGENQVNKFV